MFGQQAQTMVEEQIGAQLFSGPYPLSTFIYQGKQTVLRPLKNPLYDTETLPAAAINNRTFFARPIGAADAAAAIANKQRTDTNLTQAGMLSAPDVFAIYGFTTTVQYAVTLADFLRIYTASLFQFTFSGNRVYLEVPLNRIPTGTAPGGFADTMGAPTMIVRHGTGASGDMYPFQIQNRTLWILPNETFGVTVSWRAAITCGVATEMQVHIVGMLYKSI